MIGIDLRVFASRQREVDEPRTRRLAIGRPCLDSGTVGEGENFERLIRASGSDAATTLLGAWTRNAVERGCSCTHDVTEPQHWRDQKSWPYDVRARGK